MIEAKAFRTFTRIYYSLKSERLRANIKLTLHKTLIRFVMTYTSSAWEFATHTHLMNFQSLKNKVLRNLGNFPRCSPVLHPSVCTSLCNKTLYATSRSHEDKHVRGIGQGEERHRKYERLKLGGVKVTTVQNTQLTL